jgi:polysaccharide deacetylase family protein (PEP-CTERM system associated)
LPENKLKAPAVDVMKNILSFDIEEHFQVSGLAAAISRDQWDSFPSRVESSTLKVLDILERHNTKATFFILGWIAERHPKLIEAIDKAGHEIANHGFDHKLVYDMTVEQFADDVKRTDTFLKEITGKEVLGYRAPSFSIGAGDNDQFKALADLGYKYDSSLFPMKHFRYAAAESVPLSPFDIKLANGFSLREFPMTVINFLGRRIPAGGGGYFRLYPDFFLRRNIRKVAKQGRPAIIYLHPWEFDPGQPRVKGAGFGNTFRHYVNLAKTENKLSMILNEFDFGPFRDFLN